jgi:hypothetical protein
MRLVRLATSFVVSLSNPNPNSNLDRPPIAVTSESEVRRVLILVRITCCYYRGVLSHKNEPLG